MDASPSQWVVCQIGARENYSVARALAQEGRLLTLITDVWAAPNMTTRVLRTRIGERCHTELTGSMVWAPTVGAVIREMSDKLLRRRGWDQIMHRNAWFQRQAIRRMRQIPDGADVTVFAYSYAAADIFAYAQGRGWTTVLGQIDPGPVEARLVEQVYADAGQSGQHAVIPAAYWDTWRREVDHADVVVVNSDWSKAGLQAKGVPGAKIEVVPLAYEGAPRATNRAAPPRAFDVDRPLKLLFLGQVTLRKGIDLVFEALRLHPDLPVQLDVVGPLQADVPQSAQQDPRITLHGGVPRSAVAAFYAQADVFVFPTRSDGFGLTQLEALAQGLPIIASDRCGAVVTDGVNGAILTDLTVQALGQMFAQLCASPDMLARWQAAAHLGQTYSLDHLARRLLSLDVSATGEGAA